MIGMPNEAWLRGAIAPASKTLLVGMAIALGMVAAMSPALGVDTKRIEGEYKLGPFLSMNTVTPVDKTDHVLVQFVRSDRMTSGS